MQLPPPSDWRLQEHYNVVLGLPLFWFFVSNAIGVTIGSWLNVRIMSKWKILLEGRYFILRSISSSCIGELVTSIIVDTLAFLFFMSVVSLGKLILAIYFVKVVYAILLAFPAKLIIIILRNIENTKECPIPYSTLNKNYKHV